MKLSKIIFPLLLGTTLCGCEVRGNSEDYRTISFVKSKHATLTGDGEYLIGTKVTIKAVPDVGYTFDGWRVDNYLVSKNDHYKFEVDKNLTFEAMISETIYNVYYNCDGGHLENDLKEQPFTISTPTFSLPIPEKSGCTFNGWLNIVGDGGIITKVEQGTHYNIIIKALWE